MTDCLVLPVNSQHNLFALTAVVELYAFPKNILLQFADVSAVDEESCSYLMLLSFQYIQLFFKDKMLSCKCANQLYLAPHSVSPIMEMWISSVASGSTDSHPETLKHTEQSYHI